jgi:hypothetical protein
MVTVEATYIPIQGAEETKLLQAIQPGHSHTFGPRKTEKGSQMFIDQFYVTDGENKRDNTFSAPFVEQDKDKKVLILEETEDGQDFTFLKR